MTDVWITADQVFDGRDLHQNAGLRIVDGVVRELGHALQPTARLNGLVSPGFVDLQVNGGGGALFNTTPTPDGIATIVAAHRRGGTTWVMPTVISDAPEVLDAAAAAIRAVGQMPGVIGLHIEGPHISPARRGTHAGRYVRPLDDRTMAIVADLRAADVAVMITLAPEAATLAQIAALAGLGAIVSLGHTNATAAEIAAALKAGATCGTHLFNAMSPMLGREPGAVGAIINADCYAGIICDGEHVADSMVGLAVRARPVPDRTFLVSDAMPTVEGPSSFKLYGQDIMLKDGRLVNAEGSLAGAHVTQAQGVKRLVGMAGVPLNTALRMATSIPAGCVGRPEIAQLIGCPLSDLILLAPDLDLIGPVAQVLSSNDLSDVGT